MNFCGEKLHFQWKDLANSAELHSRESTY